MVCVFHRLIDNAAAIAGRHLQTICVKIELSSDLMMLVHGYLHDQICGFSRTGVTRERILCIRRSGQSDFFISMISLFLRNHGHSAVITNSEVQLVSIEVEFGSDIVMLVHHDFHDRIRGACSSSIAFESILGIRRGRQGYHFIAMVSLLFRVDRYASVRTNLQIDTIRIEVEFSGDIVMLVHHYLHDRIRGACSSSIAFESILGIRRGRQGNNLVPVVGLLLRRNSDCAIRANLQIDTIRIEVELSRDIVMLIHCDLHHQVGGLCRASISFEGVFGIWSSRQSYDLIPMVSLLFRVDRYASASGGFQINTICVEVELGINIVMLVHHDLHDQVGGFCRSGVAFESVFSVRCRRQSDDLIHMIGLFLGRNFNATIRANIQIQPISIKVKACFDRVMLIHHNLHHLVRGGSRASEPSESILIIRCGSQNHLLI